MVSRLTQYANTCILAIHLGILSGGRYRYTFCEWCTYGCKAINTLWWRNLILFWYKCTKFGSIPFIAWSISLILFPDKEMISGFYNLLQSLLTNWWIMLLCNEAVSSKKIEATSLNLKAQLRKSVHYRIDEPFMVKVWSDIGISTTTV